MSTATVTTRSCPVCGGDRHATRFAVPAEGSEGGVDAGRFRPSDLGFGRPPGLVVRCRSCGHSFTAEDLDEGEVASAYADAADPVSLREEPGQVATGDALLRIVEQTAAAGTILDIGCWTGSLLAAAEARGWRAVGVEPSRWASARARERGLDVRTGDLAELPTGPFRCVALCDVLEHLADPAAAVAQVREILEPGGALAVTVPDAGSGLARVMGRRWWSVLPMHLQYFTRASMRRLLEAHGFEVVAIRTHPKRFTVRYYAERLGGYSAAAERAITAVARRSGTAERLIGPDLRDRMLVIARRTPAARGQEHER